MRELRGGVRGFYVLILCIALGVMAIAGVGSFSESLTGGLAREGRTILGGDVVLLADPSRGDRTPSEQFLQSRGQVSVAATMRAMARASADKMSLVEIKAVDGAYPLVGHDGVRAGDAACAMRSPSAAMSFGALADPALLVRLDLAAGRAHHRRRRDLRNPRRLAQ